MDDTFEREGDVSPSSASFHQKSLVFFLGHAEGILFATMVEILASSLIGLSVVEFFL